VRTANLLTDFLYGVAALLSINPTKPEFSTDFVTQWMAFLNTRITDTWEMWDWSEFFVTEERAFRTVWRSDQNYFTGDDVYFLPKFSDGVINTNTSLVSATANFTASDAGNVVAGIGIVPGTKILTFTNSTTVVLDTATTATATGVTFTISRSPAYFTALSEVPQGTTPINTTYWTPITTLDKYIAYDQMGQRPIGMMRGVYNVNPRLVPSLYPPGIPYRPSEKGIDVWPYSGATVFVNYKIVPSKFTATNWQQGTYSYGQTVFYTDGNCYQCGVRQTTALPTDITQWFIVPLPIVLVDYLTRAVAGDAADDSQTEAVLLKEADDLLSGKINTLAAQGQKFRYNLGRQHRSRDGWCYSLPFTGGFVSTLNDALFSPLTQDRRPSWITEGKVPVVTETGQPIIVP